MEANSDVWIGWTWWAAGEEWPFDYLFNLQPGNGNSDRMQMGWLRPYMTCGDPAPIAPVTSSPTAPPTPAVGVLIYGDSLQSGYSDSSWLSNIKCALRYV